MKHRRPMGHLSLVSLSLYSFIHFPPVIVVEVIAATAIAEENGYG